MAGRCQVRASPGHRLHGRNSAGLHLHVCLMCRTSKHVNSENFVACNGIADVWPVAISDQRLLLPISRGLALTDILIAF